MLTLNIDLSKGSPLNKAPLASTDSYLDFHYSNISYEDVVSKKLNEVVKHKCFLKLSTAMCSFGCAMTFSCSIIYRRHYAVIYSGRLYRIIFDLSAFQ